VVFGNNKGTVELWLGIKVPHSDKKKVQMQYLMELKNEHDNKTIPGMYILTTAKQVHAQTTIAYEFKDIEFLVITPKSKGGRSQTKKVKVQTKSPLDAGELQKLRDEIPQRQQKLADEEEEDRDENGSLAASDSDSPIPGQDSNENLADAVDVAHQAPVRSDNKEAKETDVPRNNDMLMLTMAGSPANGQPGTMGRSGAN